MIRGAQNEATSHGTLPWTGAGERRCAVYRYTPKFMTYHHAYTNYADDPSSTLPGCGEATRAANSALRPTGPRLPAAGAGAWLRCATARLQLQRRACGRCERRWNGWAVEAVASLGSGWVSRDTMPASIISIIAFSTP